MKATCPKCGGLMRGPIYRGPGEPNRSFRSAAISLHRQCLEWECWKCGYVAYENCKDEDPALGREGK